MNLLKLFNPQGWTGQLILLGLFAATFTLTGWILGQNFQIKITPDPLPTTSQTIEVKANGKAKKDGNVTLDFGLNQSMSNNCNCDSLILNNFEKKRDAVNYVRGLYRD